MTGHLDQVERALGGLSGDAAAKAATTDAMARLSDELEAHLRFEEEQLAPALNALSQVVSQEEVPAPQRSGMSGSPGR